MPLKLNPKESTQHFPVQLCIFAYQEIAMIGILLNKDCVDMLSGNRVSSEFINNIDM